MACKTCRLLSQLDAGDADYLNGALMSGLISAVDARGVLERHAGSIGVTSVREHRSADHRDFPRTS